MEAAGFSIVDSRAEASNNANAYEITGPDCQILTINLKAGQRIEAEPGSMMFMSPHIQSSAEMGNCSRLCVGEGLCKAIYRNPTDSDIYVALTPNFPAKVVPIDLSQTGKFIAKKGAYMSSLGDVKVALDVDCNPCTCCCGGLGMARTGAAGTGTVFLAAGGTVMMKTLAENETVVVDETSLVGFQDTVTVNIRAAGGCLTCCCGGEGMFLTQLKGPGLIILQSMSFEKFKQAVAPDYQNNPAEESKESKE